jgi:hypothetical protein
MFRAADDGIVSFNLGLWTRAFALTVLAVIAFTNALNRIKDTTLDFPPAA